MLYKHMNPDYLEDFDDDFDEYEEDLILQLMIPMMWRKRKYQKTDPTE